MLVTLAGMVMEVKAGADRNAPYPMLVRDEGASNVTVVKADAYRNAYSPMLVTLAGMIMEVKADADRNAPYPMLVTLAGMVMEVKADA